MEKKQNKSSWKSKMNTQINKAKCEWVRKESQENIAEIRIT